ncbi:MAG: MmgE/PrpD family protein, partial [Parvularculaceae bacterium]|nr:MmgE/PrpD family protein [Parvularculaceae bacterium]
TTIDDIGGAVIERAKNLCISSLSSAVIGSGMTVARLLTDYVRNIDAVQDATVIGTNLRASAEWAAALNCSASHCTELEDVAWPDATYTCFLVPTVFSLGEKLGASGARVLEALVIGYEITSRSGMTTTDGGAMTRGWLTCSAMGTIGAAAAAAKLMRLDADKTLNAIAVAASLGAGLNRQTGSGAHVVEAGFAGKNGVMAAALAASGLTGNPTILEGPAGFWDAISGCPDLEFELGKGDDFRVMSVGMKKYPCCYLSQRIIDGVLDIMAGENLSADDVVEVEVGVNRMFPQILKYPTPRNAEEARFSLPHIIASAISGESMFVDTFTEARVADPALIRQRDKVKMIVHPEWGDAQLGEKNTLVINTTDGRKIARNCRTARGDPSNPLSREELMARYLKFSDSVMKRPALEKSADMLATLEDLDDVSLLMQLYQCN